MKREPRWMFIAYSIGLGALVAVAALIGDQPKFALFAIVWMAVIGILGSMMPWGRLRASSQDERERSIGSEAIVVSYVVLILVTLAAWLIELARGGDGMPYAWLAAAGGASYCIALGFLSVRR